MIKSKLFIAKKEPPFKALYFSERQTTKVNKAPFFVPKIKIDFDCSKRYFTFDRTNDY